MNIVNKKYRFRRTQFVHSFVWASSLIFNLFSATSKNFAYLYKTTDDLLVIGDSSNSNIYVYKPFGHFFGFANHDFKEFSDNTITANTQQSQCVIELESANENYKIASGNVDGSISILEIFTNSLLATLKGHSSKVNSLL